MGMENICGRAACLEVSRRRRGVQVQREEERHGDQQNAAGSSPHFRLARRWSQDPSWSFISGRPHGIYTDRSTESRRRRGKSTGLVEEIGVACGGMGSFAYLLHEREGHEPTWDTNACTLKHG